MRDAGNITIIVPTGPASGTKVREADKGGTRDGMLDAVVGVFRSKEVSADKVEEQMQTIVAHVKTMVGAIGASPVGDMELSGIEIGLAISAEGSIGIATAGMEATMTLSFAKSGTG